MWNLKKTHTHTHTHPNQTTNLQRRRSDLWLPGAVGAGRGSWTKEVKRYKLTVITFVSAGDGMYILLYGRCER